MASMAELLMPYTDRVTPQDRGTALKKPTSIDIVFNSEVDDPSMCVEFLACVCIGWVFDKKRSYIYLRENSVETNSAWKPCYGMCPTQDMIWTKYFDREPFEESCCPGCCGGPQEYMVRDSAILCCCIKVDLCCCSKSVVLAPPQKPFPCCCCSNLTNNGLFCCDGNCFGCCGALAGQPIHYRPIILQPKDPEGFVMKAYAVQKGKFKANAAWAGREMVQRGTDMPWDPGAPAPLVYHQF